MIHNSKFIIHIRLWLLPMFISAGLFLVLRPTLAQIVEGEQTSLTEYLLTNNVEIGQEIVSGFVRIYYLYNGQKIYISDTGQNSKQPYTMGKYIVWITEIGDAPGQVFLYDILSGTKTQITFSGTNGNAKVSKEGNVVWEGQNPSADSVGNEGWQVYLFDGNKIRQLTVGDISFNPVVDGDFVSFTRRDITDTYRSVVYSINRNESREVTSGISSKYVKVRNGKIFLGEMGREEFALTVDDLFLLNLVPLRATDSAATEQVTPTPAVVPDEPEIVTEQDILKELDATPSGEIRI